MCNDDSLFQPQSTVVPSQEAPTFSHAGVAVLGIREQPVDGGNQVALEWPHGGCDRGAPSLGPKHSDGIAPTFLSSPEGPEPEGVKDNIFSSSAAVVHAPTP